MGYFLQLYIKSEITSKSQVNWRQWLIPVILATQEAEIRRIMVQNQPLGKQFVRPYLKKSHYKKGLAEWGENHR
jgi:hypothetical protein